MVRLAVGLLCGAPGRPQEYDENGQLLVCEITKNVYGSPRGPRRWHIEIHNAMIEHGLTQSTTDQCLCVKDGLRVLVYSDDCMSTFDDCRERHFYCTVILYK